MDPENKRYQYDRFGSKGARVGQAVVDMLSQHQPVTTVGDVLEGYAPKFLEEFEKCINENKHKFDHPFYVFVLTTKEMWAENVVRNWFIARNTPPSPLGMMIEYSQRTKTLYLVDGKNGNVKLLWSLPGWEECKTILKNKQMYAPELVEWIGLCLEGKLERDTHSFDQFSRVA